jgi:hypothetical protein
MSKLERIPASTGSGRDLKKILSEDEESSLLGCGTV